MWAQSRIPVCPVGQNSKVVYGLVSRDYFHAWTVTLWNWNDFGWRHMHGVFKLFAPMWLHNEMIAIV